jgi:HYR domain
MSGRLRHRGDCGLDEEGFRMKRSLWLLTAALGALALLLPLGASAGGSPSTGVAAAPTLTSQARGADATGADSGTLTFAAKLDVRYPPADCAAGTPSGVDCFARAGEGIIRGLGSVSESFGYEIEGAPADCAVDMVRLLPATARLSVPGKGEIELRVDGTGCVTRVIGQPLHAQAHFTIAGGSGRYVGASGGGTYTDESFGPPADHGRDTWTGTLVVPGLDFDLTPPVLSGARSRTIRAPIGRARVRVAYSVTAQDDVDGTLTATCRPRSRSWFKVGRTTVRCSAIDTSGNEGTATFVVTVRHPR